MGFQDKVVVITGGAQGIGRCLAEEFAHAGAKVCLIDKEANGYFQGDVADRETLETFAEKVICDYGHVDILINNALPIMKGIGDCTYDDFAYALAVGVTAPFYLTQLLVPHFRAGGCVVNLSSTRAHMSQAQTESYSAAKGGIAALTHAMAVSLAGKVRVNAVSPGWIETAPIDHAGPDATQHPVHRVGNPLDIAHMVLFLCSEKAGFITGENICIDGGMSRQMIYHGDRGWVYAPNDA